MFFSPFQVIYLLSKQIYKLELLARWKIHDFFHMSLLEFDTIKKKRVNKLLELELKVHIRKNMEYKKQTIKNSAIYGNEAARS